MPEQLTTGEVHYVRTMEAPWSEAPLSQAVVHSGLVHTSGITGVNPRTGEIPSDVAKQARQMLRNVEAVLHAAGSSLDLVLKSTVFLRNASDSAVVDGIYGEFLGKPWPACSTIQAHLIQDELLVQIEVLARARSSDQRGHGVDIAQVTSGGEEEAPQDAYAQLRSYGS